MSDSFDFLGKVTKIDETLKHAGVQAEFKRTAFAYVGGLIKTAQYAKVRRLAANNGVSDDELMAIDRFMNDDPMSMNICKAFCQSSWYNLPAEETAREHGADLATVKAMLNSNCFALFYTWPPGGWPKGI